LLSFLESTTSLGINIPYDDCDLGGDMFNLSSNDRGIYVVKIITNNQIITQKLLYL